MSDETLLPLEACRHDEFRRSAMTITTMGIHRMEWCGTCDELLDSRVCPLPPVLDAYYEPAANPATTKGMTT